MIKPTAKKTTTNFGLRKQTHTWEPAVEKPKQKPLETNEKIHVASFGRLNQTPAGGQKTNIVTAHNHSNLPIGPDGPVEGFFPCPYCTCWFSHRRDLDFHVEKWCDRAKAESYF